MLTDWIRSKFNYENGHARKQFTQNKKTSKHGASWRVPTCLPTNPATRVPHPYDTRANVCVGVGWILGLTRDLGVKKRYVSTLGATTSIDIRGPSPLDNLSRQIYDISDFERQWWGSNVDPVLVGSSICPGLEEEDQYSSGPLFLMSLHFHWFIYQDLYY